jgi:hypothetical protein
MTRSLIEDGMMRKRRKGGVKKPEINPLEDARLSHLSHAPICGARTKEGPCEGQPISGRRRCRLHGGLSPGAPRGRVNGNYRQGDWTIEAQAERKWVRELVRSLLKVGAP